MRPLKEDIYCHELVNWYFPLIQFFLSCIFPPQFKLSGIFTNMKAKWAQFIDYIYLSSIHWTWQMIDTRKMPTKMNRSKFEAITHTKQYWPLSRKISVILSFCLILKESNNIDGWLKDELTQFVVVFSYWQVLKHTFCKTQTFNEFMIFTMIRS